MFSLSLLLYKVGNNCYNLVIQYISLQAMFSLLIDLTATDMSDMRSTLLGKIFGITFGITFGISFGITFAKVASF